MKRFLYIFAVMIFCIILLLPQPIFGETYSPEDTDITLKLDETQWYVFTKDNIKNNPKLKGLGLSEDEVSKHMDTNKLRIYAISALNDGELVEFFIRKTENPALANLKNLDKSEILNTAKTFTKEKNIENYSVYGSKQPFIRIEYFDKNANYNMCEFLTVVNKENYTLTFQSLKPFSADAHKKIENVIDNVSFDVDETLKETLLTKKESSTLRYMKIGLIGSVAGIFIGVVYSIIKKKKNQDKNLAENRKDDDVNQ